MVFFEEELERRTHGRIEVETYFSGTLGTERQLMDLVATGVLHGTRGGFYADANRKYSLFELPFLVEDWDQLLRLIYSDFTGRINRGARGERLSCSRMWCFAGISESYDECAAAPYAR